jgi:hypothetical protein
MNSIILKRYVPVEIELQAAAAITPGHLVELTSAGKVQKHSTEAGNAAKMFAIENSIVGEGINTDIAADDMCAIWLPRPGDEVYAILTTSQTVVIGDFLSSKGDGTLKLHVAESSDYYAAEDVTVKPLQIVAQAIEAVTTTNAVSRIKVRIV